MEQKTMQTVHEPKFISSNVGMGLPNTVKSYEDVGSLVRITTEVWQEMEKPWTESGVIIANPGYVWKTTWEVGKNYVKTEFLDEKGMRVGTYYDICSPVQKSVEAMYSFYDWYLDVWQPEGGDPTLLDEDELEVAVNCGHLTINQVSIAKTTVNSILAGLIKS